MDVGIALSVVQTIITVLQGSELRAFCSSSTYREELQKLEMIVKTINAVLLGAEAKGGDLSEEERVYIEELKHAIYGADDVLDEFVTLAQRKMLTKGNKVRPMQFLKKCADTFIMYREVKKIRENLSQIAEIHNKFKLNIDYQPLRMRREETCSYVCAQRIIGRDDDVNKILGMMRESSVQRGISMLSIVGMGGLGKTALAQLVYGSQNVKNKFDLRLWVCVSDQDQQKINLKEILGKVLETILGRKHEVSSMDTVQQQLKLYLEGKNYLLVLDDVWTENRSEWLQLEELLEGSGRRGWVLVTTRSKETARIIGNGQMYELQGLSDDYSWHLFKQMAFSEIETEASSQLIDIGKQITRSCRNVPLAIRAVGTLLYGQRKSKWERVLEAGLADIMSKKGGIMSILKLSYDNLESPLKSCFSYCAIFPKDFVIDKDTLIRLWIAQGYVTALKKGQNVVTVAEDYFKILMRRCFFQDVVFDGFGEIQSCKIHDLIHDIAVEVSKKEICEVNLNTIGGLNERVRHVSFSDKDQFLKASARKAKSHIRTYVYVSKSYRWGTDELLVEKLVASCRRLRSVDLSRSSFEILPTSIGKLLHLRYLDLSCNGKLKVIPQSITKLHNLNFLGIELCPGLTSLPLGMDKLVNLHMLPRFIVGKASKGEKEFYDELQNLKSLNNLKGFLEIEIEIPTHSAIVSAIKEDSRRGAYLNNKQHLVGVGITFENLCKNIEFEEMVLEELQPPSRLTVLGLCGYNGARLPSWAIADNLSTFVSDLAHLVMRLCPKLLSLPALGKMRYLKNLYLDDLPNLEYMEDNSSQKSSTVVGSWEKGSSSSLTSSFPCLEILTLLKLPKLRRWWSESTSFPCFTHLKRLEIRDCAKMLSIPFCLHIESLIIRDGDRRVNLEIIGEKDVTSSPHPMWKLIISKNLGHLKLLSVEYLQHVTELFIEEDDKIETFASVKGFLQTTFSSLRSLKVAKCMKLRSLCGFLEHLSLEEVWILGCPKLFDSNPGEPNKEDKDAEVRIPWQTIAPNLLKLTFELIDPMMDLPKEMQYLTSLQSLRFICCKRLQSFPKWMPELTSLTQLAILSCSWTLQERCHNSAGEDWSFIQHIPNICIEDHNKWLCDIHSFKFERSACS